MRPASAGTMDSEAFQSTRDLLDLNFQSLAMKHMDLKQMELDTAAAKVDELTKQLESLWSDSPTPPGSQAGAPPRLSRYSSSPVPEPFSSRGSPRKVATDGADTSFGRSESAPALHPYSPLSPKGRPSSPRTPLYLQPDSYGSLDRAPSPRPRPFDGTGSSLGRAPSPRPGSGPLRQQGPPTPFDFLGRAGSPRGSPLAEGPQAFFPERGPSPRPQTSAYDAPVAFGSPLLGAGGSAFAPPLRAQDDLTLRRRPPKAWNESDLDVAYEKKPSQTASYERLPKPPPELEPEPELEGLLPPVLEAGDADEGAVTRPLSPTRLQPALPPEAQSVPELEEVARVLAEIPRPLKRRGSMEQSPAVALPPTHKKQYQQIISRLFHRHGGPGGPEPELSPISEGSEARAGPPAPAPPALIPPLPLPQISPPEQLQSMVSGAKILYSPDSLTVEMRSVLRKAGSPRKVRRARLNPLVLLLDAALTGELDVVQQAVKEMNDPSQPNEEGITALHNAICGANYPIVDFLIAAGANVNSPDSHGWTPLHCAASCNDTAICTALVQHGAAIFATTLSDGATAIEKCDPYREGYADCATYLADVEQSMGLMHNGVVYALWDYSAEFGDELSFREGESVTVLRRDGPEETDWWWASLHGQEGYVPRNYFGLFPRVKTQRNKV
ncbi:relA-associated inhibitor isoform X6 [Mirounga angustirostris]|uniref:relA-associated inhibitor isoform X6 n=1 Tax=Mirounga angustirostris TaxID=9716 RepID=UPI00313D881E